MKCKDCGFRIRSNKRQDIELRKEMHNGGEHHKRKHPKLRKETK